MRIGTVTTTLHSIALLCACVGIFAGIGGGQALGIPTNAPQARPASAAGYWLAYRGGDGKLRINLDRVQAEPGQRRFEEAPLSESQFAAAEAKREGNFTHRGPADAHIGDVYELMVSGTDSVQVRIIGFYALNSVFERRIGALVAGDQATEARLLADGAAPFLARRAGATASPSAPLPDSRDGLFSPSITPEVNAQIAVALTKRMRLEARKYFDGNGEALDPVLGPLDAKLLANPETPKLEIQGVRLANGSERYFARAEWDVAGAPAFLLGAWMTPSPSPIVVSVDLTGADEQRAGFGGERGSHLDGLDAYKPLLRVLDMGDGRTGIIRHLTFHGDSRYELDYYAERAGFVQTDLAF